MERRSFFKIIGTASGGLLTGACGKPGREIIPILVPEQEIVAGVEEWQPSVCRECGAGCGTIVRLMEAERTIERDKQTFREKIAAVKKIEGNPLDPVSGGRLCARGQATVQALYHPDRVRGPLKRSGDKGSAKFESITWDAALDAAAAAFKKADPKKIVFLSRSEASSRSVTIAAFLKNIGASPASAIPLCDHQIERKAAERVFGWQGLPVYDVQDSDYVLSIGADFLGGWVSPVFYARQYGAMRRGKAGRGQLVQAESRFSLAAANADRWLPVRPGGEAAFALAVGNVLISEKLAPGQDRLPGALRDGFASVNLTRAAQISGLRPEQIRQVAHELAKAQAPVVVAGASIVQANSLDAVVAGNLLNLLLGTVGRKGGVMPPAPSLIASYAASRPESGDLMKRLDNADLIVLDGVNPVYALPATSKLLAKAPFILSFSPLIDDSSASADLVLPDHASLESAVAIEPLVAETAALSAGRAVVKPLYETRATEDVLSDLGDKLGKSLTAETVDSAFERLFKEHKPSGTWTGADEFAAYAARQGGWWAKLDAHAPAAPKPAVPSLRDPEFQGDASGYPMSFQPYPSLQFGDGSGAHLPWMQELPDPSSSAMWGLPVEIDPGTASKLGVANGDLVRVTSPQGQLEAPAYVHPAAIPGVVSMGIGQGHKNYSRYASNQGANPLTLAAPVFESQTGAFAFGATRVRVEKVSTRGGLVQFSIVDREAELQRR